MRDGQAAILRQLVQREVSGEIRVHRFLGAPFLPWRKAAPARHLAGAVYRQVINQSYLLSSLDLFWICGWMSLLTVIFLWLAKRPAPSEHLVAAD